MVHGGKKMEKIYGRFREVIPFILVALRTVRVRVISIMPRKHRQRYFMCLVWSYYCVRSGGRSL